MKTRAFLVASLAAMAALASADQSVYSDELDNGWVSWSWGTTLNFANTSPVHSGAHSVSAAQSAWGGLYLHHSAFSSTDYSTLRFWINGGAGGQKLIVQATLNGAAQQAKVPKIGRASCRER